MSGFANTDTEVEDSTKASGEEKTNFLNESNYSHKNKAYQEVKTPVGRFYEDIPQFNKLYIFLIIFTGFYFMIWNLLGDVIPQLIFIPLWIFFFLLRHYYYTKYFPKMFIVFSIGTCTVYNYNKKTDNFESNKAYPYSELICIEHHVKQSLFKNLKFNIKKVYFSFRDSNADLNRFRFYLPNKIYLTMKDDIIQLIGYESYLKKSVQHININSVIDNSGALKMIMKDINLLLQNNNYIQTYIQLLLKNKKKVLYKYIFLAEIFMLLYYFIDLPVYQLIVITIGILVIIEVLDKNNLYSQISNLRNAEFLLFFSVYPIDNHSNNKIYQRVSRYLNVSFESKLTNNGIIIEQRQ